MPKKKTSNIKKNTMKRNESAKWNEENDKKLRILIDNIIHDPLDLNSETIHRVIGNHFPGRSYKCFSVLYKMKARLYSIALSKFGTRKGKNTIMLCLKYCFKHSLTSFFVAAATKSTFTTPLASIPSQINIDKEDSTEDETWHQETTIKYSIVELSYDKGKAEDGGKDKDKEAYNEESNLEIESYQDKKKKLPHYL